MSAVLSHNPQNMPRWERVLDFTEDVVRGERYIVQVIIAGPPGGQDFLELYRMLYHIRNNWETLVLSGVKKALEHVEEGMEYELFMDRVDYIIRQVRRAVYREWSDAQVEHVRAVRTEVIRMWFAPEGPGCLAAKQDFEATIQNT